MSGAQPADLECRKRTNERVKWKSNDEKSPFTNIINRFPTFGSPAFWFDYDKQVF